MRRKQLKTTLTVSQARQALFRLVDQTTETHAPVLITSKRTNAVLVSEDDWRALQETLYLISIPGMRKSIVEGMQTSIEACHDKPGW